MFSKIQLVFFMFFSTEPAQTKKSIVLERRDAMCIMRHALSNDLYTNNYDREILV